MASAVSLTLRTAPSNSVGKASNFRLISKSPRINSAYASMASAKSSDACVNESTSLLEIALYLRAIAAALATRGAVNSSVTACVVRSINS